MTGSTNYGSLETGIPTSVLAQKNKGKHGGELG